MVDAWVQIAVFGFVIVAGLMWGRRAWRRWSEYSFAEDFRATFLRVRWAYSGDLCDGGLRLIAPAMVVCGGLGGLVWVLVRRPSSGQSQLRGTDLAPRITVAARAAQSNSVTRTSPGFRMC